MAGHYRESPGTWETRHLPGTVIVVERRVKTAVMGCRESDQLIVAGYGVTARAVQDGDHAKGLTGSVIRARRR